MGIMRQKTVGSYRLTLSSGPPFIVAVAFVGAQGHEHGTERQYATEDGAMAAWDGLQLAPGSWVTPRIPAPEPSLDNEPTTPAPIRQARRTRQRRAARG